MTRNLNVLTIGYAKRLFDVQSREFKRLVEYAGLLQSLHVIVFTTKKNGIHDVLTHGNLSIYPTNSHTRIGALIDAFRIGRRILRNRSGDDSWVITSQDPFETSLVGRSLSRSCDVPHHVQLHGDNFSPTPWRFESMLNRIRYRYGLKVLRTSKAVRVASERIKRSLLSHGIREDTITVLPIRPELEAFLREERPKRSSGITFLSLGRLSKEKDILRIVDAFARLVKEGMDARLRIIGEGRELSRIVARVREHNIADRVTFVPWTEDVPHEMAHADIFLLASHHEAYALTLVEALAAGLPIITTDVGCVGELVKDGIHGIVVYEKGIPAYAQAMKKMATDTELRHTCGARGRETGRKLALVPREAYAAAWVTAIGKAVIRV